MSVRIDSRRHSRPERNVGYSALAVLFIAVWFVTNGHPGWQEARILTDSTVRVLDLFNVAMMLGAATNVTLIVYDPKWFKSLMNLAVAGTAMVAVWQILKVFPFTFAGLHFNFAALTTLGLGALVVALGAAVLVNLVVVLGAAGRMLGLAAQPEGTSGRLGARPSG